MYANSTVFGIVPIFRKPNGVNVVDYVKNAKVSNSNNSEGERWQLHHCLSIYPPDLGLNADAGPFCMPPTRGDIIIFHREVGEHGSGEGWRYLPGFQAHSFLFVE